MSYAQLFDSLAAAWFHQSPRITITLTDGEALDVTGFDAHEIFEALRGRGRDLDAIRAVSWSLPTRART